MIRFFLKQLLGVLINKKTNAVVLHHLHAGDDSAPNQGCTLSLEDALSVVFVLTARVVAIPTTSRAMHQRPRG